MNKLTTHQFNFVLSFFVKDDKVPGLLDIATLLINNGECIVSGDSPLWNGGIGNFIKTEKAKYAYGCLKYTFDLNEFLSSNMFRDVSDIHLTMLSKQKSELEAKYDEITKL